MKRLIGDTTSNACLTVFNCLPPVWHVVRAYDLGKNHLKISVRITYHLNTVFLFWSLKYYSRRFFILPKSKRKGVRVITYQHPWMWINTRILWYIKDVLYTKLINNFHSFVCAGDFKRYVNKQFLKLFISNSRITDT